MSGGAAPNGRRPEGHKLPQIVLSGVRRKSLKSDVITFKWNVLRLVELSFIVAIPAHDGGKAPVYVRFLIDWSKEDAPGTVVVGDGIGE